MSYINMLLVFIFSIILSSALINLFIPDKSYAGVPDANMIGCCLDIEGNCSGGCENNEAGCATLENSSCDGTIYELADFELCEDDCFAIGAVCVQGGSGGSCEFPPSGIDCTVASEDCGELSISDEDCFTAGCALSSCVESPLEEQPDSCSETETAGPTVIVPTMSQWGMIFASLILGIAAVITLRRRTEF